MHKQTDIREYLSQHRLLFDGAFGTYYTRLVHADEKSGPCEAGNVEHADLVQRIHEEYIAAGANAIKTNTFGAYAELVGGEEKQEAIVSEGCRLAFEAADAVDNRALLEQGKRGEQFFVFGDLGQAPGETAEEMAVNYIALADFLLKSGIENFLFETLSVSDGLVEAVKYIREKKPDAFIIASFGVLTDGYTSDGMQFEKMLTNLSESKLFDVFGLNCVTSASHMKMLVKKLPEGLRKRMSVMPNAGYPVVRGFHTVFEGKSSYFVEGIQEMAKAGVPILGGCCGTTPDYIRRVREMLEEEHLLDFTGEGAEGNSGKVDWTIPISVKEMETGKKRSETEKAAALPFREAGEASGNRLKSKLDAGQKIIAVELDSPVGADSGKFMRGAAELQEAGVDCITIADNPIARARMDATVLACKVKQTLDLDVIPHMTCRDRNANATRSLLLGAYADGIRNVLIVTGDPIPTAKRDEVQKVYQFNSRKLISYVDSLNEELFEEPMNIFGALNVNARNFEIELGRAVEKVADGAKGFLTQPAMTDEAVMNLKHAKEVLRDSTKIIGGIIPVVSEKNGRFMESEISGIHLSEEMINSYHGLEREEAEELAVKYSLLYARKMADYVDGYYLMTPFGRTGLMARIVAALKKE